MASADWFFLVATAGVGAIFGSFFSVVTHRLHTRESGFLTGSSRCVACGHELSARDLVPIVSWALARGRCRYCGAPVSAAYPLLEAATGAAATIASAGLAHSFAVPLSTLPTLGEWWWTMGILLVLMPIAWYDMRHMEIPDEIVRPAALSLLLLHFAAWILGWRMPFFGNFSWTPNLPPLAEALISALAIFAFFALQILLPGAIYAIRHARWRSLGELMLSVLVFPFWMLSLAGLAKREDETGDEPLPAWMGWGDLRLAIFMGLAGGAWGLVGVACAYVVGSAFGVAWLAAGRSSVVPFGPFLALGLLTALSWGNLILAWFPF